jgi:CheY-like chemotaxis protein
MNSDRDKPRQLNCVLCVDDNEDFQSIIKISLESLGGIEVHFCTDPQHAMARAREVKPDLILLDFLMPGLDGATLFKQLQSDVDLAQIPVVFLTAVLTRPEVNNLKLLGAAGILAKPCNLRELPRNLSAIWNSWNIANPAELP